MEINLSGPIRQIIDRLADKHDIPREEAREIAHEKLFDRDFEQIAASLRKDYPDATDEDLEVAITVEEDGYSIDFTKLPPPPLEEELESLKQAGISKVWILSQRDMEVCDRCMELDGQEYTVEEAIENMPLVNHKCENDHCRCTYMPGS